ncbi:MAG TPA: MCP four helix bundle domain-containing protein, partial [Leptospiraceae bacterium]|nr:MCP four helix bundle domain-containing protein [Leptospiraceae bacterium]
MFKNLSIKSMLVLSFSGVLLLFLGMSIYNLFALNEIQTSVTGVVNDRIPKILILHEMNNDLNQTARSTRSMLLLEDPREIQKERDAILNVRDEKFPKVFDYLKTVIRRERGKELLSEATRARDSYIESLNRFLGMYDSFQKEDAKKLLLTELRPRQHEFARSLKMLTDYQKDIVTTEGKKTEENVSQIYFLFFIISILGTLITILVTFVATQKINSTTSRMDEFISDINIFVKELESKGDFAFRLKIAHKDEMGKTSEALNRLMNMFQGIQRETNLLSRAAIEGKLNTRADLSGYIGDFRNIIEGVNKTLDAVIGPLNVAADYVDKISKGTIPKKITDNYNGDFNEIKNNINSLIEATNMIADVAYKLSVGNTKVSLTKRSPDDTMIENLIKVIENNKHDTGNVVKMAKGDFNFEVKVMSEDDEMAKSCVNLQTTLKTLIADMAGLSKAAVEGKLATRADATKHQGDYRKIVEGVNQTLDAVIGPLNVAADYVDKISRGAIPAKITDTYNGDFNTIKNNLNNAIDNVNALVADAAMLSKAAIEGKLATRADATKHQGDYRKIVEGVNQTLDAVIGPLNVAADYVDKISRGAIPPKITETYNGDFNTIKNNLNNAIDNVNALVADAAMLSKAAIEGKLATRADATKHQGDYRKIVEGVNQTLDAVIGPLNVAADYVDKISRGAIPAKITDTYNGDFNTIKNNL